MESPSKSPSKMALNKKIAWRNANNSNNSSTSLSFASNKSTGSGSGSSASTSIDEEVDSLMNDRIIQSLTSKYTQENTGDLLDFDKTLEHLRENIKAGICLICIEDVGRNEAIWSCATCHCILHLVCIQRWARDSIANAKERAAERMITPTIVFCCPKCRNEYPETQFPDKYKCFCGKETNPSNDPWVAPHSCGETCAKPLQPECGHVCLLLCHSGPCPPCPKQVTNTCHCAQSPPKTLRCFSKTWSCGSPCSKELPCHLHPCPETCHSGPCPPCEIPTTLLCTCSSPTEIIIPCWKLTDSSSPFQLSCGSPCALSLSCGLHTCTLPCHEGPCPPCLRSCPCGKSSALCASDTVLETGKPCDESCDKPLDCGVHCCTSKCHLGPCGSCLATVVKSCRCSAQSKETLCSKEFLCGNKCKRSRDCKVHPCNRKCCPGDCPPCRLTCGKTLACKNHKCESLCHGGSPCYPCPVTGVVTCRCQASKRSVPCGSERKARPPECSSLCARPPKCDHSAIQNHRCHFGDCPKCRIPCGKTLSPCRHQCPAVCHTTKRGGDGTRPCPKCLVLVPTACPLHRGRGLQVLCSRLAERCLETCAQLLSCEVHTCQKPCHIGAGLLSDCGDCSEPCSKERPGSCPHSCDLGCHSGPCQKCTLVSRVSCHCAGEELLVQCWRQDGLSPAERSCKNQCPLKLECGHRCLTLCHEGPCPELDKCRRKVRLNCKCKHVKKEVECFLATEEGVTKILDCVPGLCPVSKKEKETPSGGSGKKRTRKKKVSEAEEATEEQIEVVAATEEKAKVGDSIFTTNLKAIGIIALSAFFFATLLKFWGHVIIPEEYRHSYNSKE